MNRYFSGLVAIFCFSLATASAQTPGIAPFSALRYFQEGITVKTITVKIDGAVLMGNRISASKETMLALEQPAGLTKGADKIIYAGAEFTLVSVKGEVLSTIPDLMAKTAATGISEKDFAATGIRFLLTPEMLKGNPFVTVKIRFFDRKSKNQLRIEFPLSIARPGESVLVTKTAKTVATPANVVNLVNGVGIGSLKLSLDSSIKVNPKMMYASLDMTGLDGVTLMDMLNGRESFWVYDQKLTEFRITDILLKNVGGSLEGGKVNYTLKIPFRLKTAPATGYLVRFRWESADKRQAIDIVFTI